MDRISPAVKTETIRIAMGTGIMTVLMWVVFWILHLNMQEQVPFDYSVILGGITGCAFAVLNFFLMGLTVQKVAGEQNSNDAKRRVMTSQRRRTFLMLLWGVVALTVPCFNGAAGLIPLLFPGVVIKVYYLTFGKNKLSEK